MPKYITKDDYYNARGIDLDIEFKNSATDNPAGATLAFLTEQEESMLDYMQGHFEFDNDEVEEQAEVMKQALIYQIDYIRQYGDDKKGYVLSTKAYQKLWNNGLANAKTSGRIDYRAYGRRC